MSDRATTFAKMSELLDAWDVCMLSGKTPGTLAVVDLRAEQLIDELLRFWGPVDHAALVASFAIDQPPMTEESLAAVPDGNVPIAVMREVLHTNKVMFSPKNVANFAAFRRRYAADILG